MQYIKQIMLLVILTISWKCQAEEVKEIWLDELIFQFFSLLYS